MVREAEAQEIEAGWVQTLRDGEGVSLPPEKCPHEAASEIFPQLW